MSLSQPPFLPMSRAEMRQLRWSELDVLLVSGDAYVDHPSFGVALLGRLLVARGYRTGIVAQPDWREPASVTAMGRPRLLAGVTAGALDSQLAHYTAFRKKRSDDAYTPGGKAGARPNRACLVYTGLVRRAFPGLPVALGGLEASLRRASHYDFWSDTLRKSILLDSKADLVCYGMAEKSLLAALERLEADDPRGLKDIPGTAFAGSAEDLPSDAAMEELPSHEEIEADPKLLLEATLAVERQVHTGGVYLTQSTGKRTVILSPPAPCPGEAELDGYYGLPFSRRAHPSYTEPIPAEAMIADSITTHRGCGGGCSFCGLALHQGRRVSSRSRKSILTEAKAIAARPGFRGSISDVGGPSANMWRAGCTSSQPCRRASCLMPKVCPRLDVDHRAYLNLLRDVARTPGVKHLRVASGVRYDLALQDEACLRQLIAEFVGGQLKVAPEHVSTDVLAHMRKPGPDVLERLLAVFAQASRAAGKEQYVVPYLMSAHPGCTDQHMDELSAWLKARGWRPQQVQCFIPLPGTVAAAMYFGGVDENGRTITVARSDAARLRQHGKLAPQRSKPPKRGQQRKPQHAKPAKASRRRGRT